MTSLDIKVNIKELTDYSASSGITRNKKTLLLMIQSFSEYMKALYGQLIEDEINSRRYKGNWEPVEEEGYLEYLGVIPKVEIIYLIKDALEVKKIGYNFIVRVNPNYKYPGTRIPLLKVLRAIENGTSDFNARPILSKIALTIRGNIIELWRGYLTMKGVI